MKVYQCHARLCAKYVEEFAPVDSAALWHLAEDNYKTGKPILTLGHVFWNFLASKRPKDGIE
jgi:hypothetical protein